MPETEVPKTEVPKTEAVAGFSDRTTGTLSRIRMLAAAVPTTRKHPSTMKITAFVNRISIPLDKPAEAFP